MEHVRLSADEQALGLRLDHGHLDVLSGKAAHVVERLEQGDDEELDLGAVGAAQDPAGAEARDARRDGRKEVAAEERVVGVGILRPVQPRQPRAIMDGARTVPRRNPASRQPGRDTRGG